MYSRKYRKIEPPRYIATLLLYLYRYQFIYLLYLSIRSNRLLLSIRSEYLLYTYHIDFIHFHAFSCISVGQKEIPTPAEPNNVFKLSLAASKYFVLDANPHDCQRGTIVSWYNNQNAANQEFFWDGDMIRSKKYLYKVQWNEVFWPPFMISMSIFEKYSIHTKKIRVWLIDCPYHELSKAVSEPKFRSLISEIISKNSWFVPLCTNPQKLLIVDHINSLFTIALLYFHLKKCECLLICLIYKNI